MADNAWIPNTIRDPVGANIMTVNTDGSININDVGVRSIAAGSVATLLDCALGVIRDPVSGTPLKVNADGSINVAAE